MRLVRVLLSTYNGARFLPAQLDSLLAQDYPRIAIFIRDDGSSDETRALLQEYANRNSSITLIFGENIGVVPSYLELLRLGGGTEDFYAFCDQDDVWETDKISTAVARLSGQADPESSLYCGRVKYVDEDLHDIGLSGIPRYVGWRNAVVENIVTGCTVVMGDKLRRLMLKTDGTGVLMHDWWAYLVGSAFGAIVYDPEAKILYRQHGNNVSQPDISRMKRILRVAGEFWQRYKETQTGFISLQQAHAFTGVYGPMMNAEDKRIVDRLWSLRKGAGLLQRFRYALVPEVYRNHRLDNLVLRIMVILGQH